MNTASSCFCILPKTCTYCSRCGSRPMCQDLPRSALPARPFFTNLRAQWATCGYFVAIALIWAQDALTRMVRRDGSGRLFGCWWGRAKGPAQVTGAGQDSVLRRSWTPFIDRPSQCSLTFLWSAPCGPKDVGPSCGCPAVAGQDVSWRSSEFGDALLGTRLPPWIAGVVLAGSLRWYSHRLRVADGARRSTARGRARGQAGVLARPTR